MPPAAQAGWYDLAFGEDYPLVYAQRDLEQARRDLKSLRERGLTSNFLDLGCGAGRHLVAARECGLVGLGLDRSSTQLALAQDAGCRVVRGDFRKLPLATQRFEAVLSLFSSFGYFDAAGDLEQLREVRRVLRVGGVLLLDLPDAATVRASLVEHSERTLGPWRIEERRWLSGDGRRVYKQVQLSSSEAPTRGWTEDLALYEPHELEQLLDRSGFELEARWNSLRSESRSDSGPKRPSEARQVLRARRR